MTIAHNLKDPSLALVAQLEIYHADDDLASAASVVSLQTFTVLSKYYGQ